MKILFNPTEAEKGSGATSYILFRSDLFRDILDKTMKTSHHEEITQLEITPDGLTARFAKKKGK